MLLEIVSEFTKVCFTVFEYETMIYHSNSLNVKYYEVLNVHVEFMILTKSVFFLQNTTSITGSPTGRRKVPVTAAFASITKWTL